MSPASDECWDYIIVGAGSAGCVLANRLSADPRNKVLLIEAGGSDRNPLQRIPAAGVLLNYGHEKRDWLYRTKPDPTRQDRVEMWPRGKLMGGTSSINGMIYVRGAKEDFDRWAALGNDGWSYRDVAPLFRRLENHEFSESSEKRHASHYGSAGPLQVRQMRGAHPLAHVFVSACAEMGIATNPHYNAETQEGACILSLTTSKRIRSSSSQAFLQPVRHRRNLHVLKNTFVTKVLLHGKKAVGVCAERKGDRQSSEVRSGHVILSAGAVNSPQLLMLSGLGPAQHLQDVGVPVCHDLPGVGQNLQDHPICPIAATVTVPTLRASRVRAVKAAFEWLLLGRGPFTAAACHALAFAKTRSDLETPDIQIHMMPMGADLQGKKRVFLKSCITLFPNVSHPRSRGVLKLASNRAHDPPAIYPNMLEDAEDIRVLVAAGRLCRHLLRTQSFQSFVRQETSPGKDVETDREWEEFVRKTALSGAHQVGSCKMGRDRMAVVDPQLRVHGVQGLRVVDASIMPTIPSGNTNASCMMIGEKGAEMILRDANRR